MTLENKSLERGISKYLSEICGFSPRLSGATGDFVPRVFIPG